MELSVEEVWIPKANLPLGSLKQEMAVENQTKSAQIELENGLNRDDQNNLKRVQKIAWIILECQTSLKADWKRLDQIYSELSKKSTRQAKSLKTPAKSKEVNRLKLELDHIRELKEKLLKILTRIDSELLEFSTQSDPLFTWSEWNNLAEEKADIKELLSKLNFDSVQKELQKDFGCSKNEILVSSILHNFFPSSLISQSGNPY